MPKAKEKDVEVITFKMDSSLKRMMRGIHNRSEFIRSAILAAALNDADSGRGTNGFPGARWL